MFLELAKRLRHYAISSGGNIALITAMTLMAVIGCGGAAVDFLRYQKAKTTLAAAADSAILAATTAAVKADKSGLHDVAEYARRQALLVWKVNTASLGNDSVGEPTVAVAKVANAWTVDLTYDEQFPTAFMGIFGVRTLAMNITAQSSTLVTKVKEFWQFMVVVDTSSSMGIGATQGDMDAMLADPSIGCMFACHWDATNTSDHWIRAKAAGYRLRINVVDDAVHGIVATMEEKADNGNISAGLYGLNRGIDELVPLTSHLDDVAAHEYTLAVTPGSVGNTNYRASLDAMTAIAGTAGDGTSPVSPKKAVFIVTDGIHDSNVWESNVVSNVLGMNDHFVGPIDPAFCSTMKNSGVIVGVLYIDYILPSGGYGAYVDPYKPQILPNLQSCASDGLFFNATSPDNINAAMQTMLQAAFTAGAVHLTR